VTASDHAPGRIRVEAVVEIEVAVVLGLERAGVEMDVQALQIFRRRHVKRHVEMLQQEAGGADMVGMEMRGDDPRQRSSAQHPVKQRLPRRLGRLVTEPGVDERPAGAVFDEVDVHVVEEERQSEPRPQDTGCDLDRGAGRGSFNVRKNELCAGGGLKVGCAVHRAG
jgi:hypothetical protein